MHPRLRAVFAEPAAPHAPARVWRDWALLAGFAPAIVLEGAFRPDLPWRVGCVVVALALLATLLWRRTRPLATVATAFGCTALAPLVLPGDPCDMYATSFLLLLCYALFRWGSGRDVLLGSVFVVAKVVVTGLAGSITGGEVVAGFAVLFAAATLGVAVRFRAAARLREFDRVKLLERERLARDLHDTVAHHVSAMAIRAQAGIAASASQPDAAVEALRVIEAEASRALAEMRAMVRVLRRDQPADLAPSPRVADIGRLAGRFRAGPAVDVQIRGDVDDLPPTVGSALYRLAQESVTNARRHARHATRIEVSVAADDTSVRLRVSDDGEPGAARPAGSPGFGLVGMMERAGLLGGTCEAGPNPDRGWTVTAVLPRAGAGS
ncbi:two-component sensor histidine kinase [Plantactinospora sp. BC1]|uniref:sensor histidine kinase n=1 Tax=Plantactinospora sp. BC1 TaxID=2108470 RepID=UPI000D17AD53|nr:sensor histidine kinase [Plantactinospora sp. BC1]AVT28389.1 two-component sensor histidine kinase [Plantactinospora sp. BC1]